MARCNFATFVSAIIVPRRRHTRPWPLRSRHAHRSGPRGRLTTLTPVLLTAEAYGRRVGVRMPAAAVTGVRSWLPYWWMDADVEPERVWELESVEQAEYVVSELELWVAEHAVDLIFVHAGVVAVDGRAVLLPGRSHAGKTSLTAALLRAGATYGSDEYAVLDSDGLVRPYPRRLSIRAGGQRTRVAAAQLGAGTFVVPIQVGAVAVMQYAPGSKYLVEPISRAIAVLRLFDNTVCATTRAQLALDALIAAVSRARTVEGIRGEAADAQGSILALLS